MTMEKPLQCKDSSVDEEVHGARYGASPSSHFHAGILLLAGLSLCNQAAHANDETLIQQRANAVVSLMSFTVVPDITASNLDIGSGTNEQSALTITQLGGGATMSEGFPSISRAPWGTAATIPSSCSPTATRPAPSPSSGTA